jgi:hypothetical protein
MSRDFLLMKVLLHQVLLNQTLIMENILAPKNADVREMIAEYLKLSRQVLDDTDDLGEHN